jgi:hypothetical protein
MDRAASKTGYRMSDRVQAASRYDVAQAIAASWRLGAGTAALPVSGRLLDHAVAECLQLFPAYMQGYFMVSQGRCLDLPDILDAAESSMMIQTNGTDFLTARVVADEGHAYRMALEVGLSKAQAVVLGQALKASVDRQRQSG